MPRRKAFELGSARMAYCSWCLTWSKHNLVEKNHLTRNVYRCENCGNYTVTCRVGGCGCMATYRPQVSVAKKLIQSIRENWSSEFCSAHDGTIPSWDNLDLKIDSPTDYRLLLERNNEWNMVKWTGGVLGVIVGGWLVVATLGTAGVPLAAALGGAGTGSIIATLNGVALSAAPFAAIGMGSATGSLILSAAGAALGGGLGLMLTNSYLGELKEFDIKRVDEGDASLPAIIFLNGFLQKDADIHDWLNALEKHFPNNPKYRVEWDSKNKASIVKMLGTPKVANLLKELVENAMPSNPAALALKVTSCLGNPWHQALHNAEKAGCALADILARTTRHKKYILMGHSLGCRVAYYAARALATRSENIIDSMYMLSGAVGIHEWKEISKHVGNVFNFFAPNDKIVGPVYQLGMVEMAEEAIGVAPIQCNVVNIHNFDVTNVVQKYDGSYLYHMRYKDAFDEILQALQAQKYANDEERSCCIM